MSTDSSPSLGAEENGDTPEDELLVNAHGLYDSSWGEDDWRKLATTLVRDGVVSWREITTTVLGELNPPQVGTSIASASGLTFGFKDNHQLAHPGESFMPYVMQWFYARAGRCIDCGTRLDLQADHVQGREFFENKRDADVLDNLELRCRRHNVAKRRSHIERAGRTVLPAQQALMWILLEIRPFTKLDLARLCRIYGMTMAGIRFDEAWAMAVWMQREGQYRIASPEDAYDVVRWLHNGALTRRFANGDAPPMGSELIASDVLGENRVRFVASLGDNKRTLRYYDLAVETLPFAYELGDRDVTDIAIWPIQTGGVPLAPKGLKLRSSIIVGAINDSPTIAFSDGHMLTAPPANGFRGTIIRAGRREVERMRLASSPDELL
ncbi:HNH endonuclease [Microbacterium galbinum]|uniref:HNH endonuclease n=1 Tax=Microbacterium galbinum TaxID=2851646 RepID=UPI001FFD3F56|nr:hypothetical protein [Microbacterium galbinum]MCK2029892.1 hypothetical protein [Microbacterium galbinum]